MPPNPEERTPEAFVERVGEFPSRRTNRFEPFSVRLVVIGQIVRVKLVGLRRERAAVKHMPGLHRRQAPLVHPDFVHRAALESSIAKALPDRQWPEDNGVQV